MTAVAAFVGVLCAAALGLAWLADYTNIGEHTAHLLGLPNELENQ